MTILPDKAELLTTVSGKKDSNCRTNVTSTAGQSNKWFKQLNLIEQKVAINFMPLLKQCIFQMHLSVEFFKLQWSEQQFLNSKTSCDLTHPVKVKHFNWHLLRIFFKQV